MTPYIFDTSAWIAAWHELYAPDVFPDVWKLIEQDVTNGIIKSPLQVRKELAKKENDVLYKWIISFKGVFSIPSIKQKEVEEIVNQIWQKSPKLMSHKPIDKNPVKADAYVIAYAEIMKCKVITQESSKKEKGMVGACRKRGVKCGNLLSYLRDRKEFLK